MGKRMNPYGQFQGTFIPLWLEQVEGLSLLAKYVYVKLIYHSGGKGYCWPSQETLAKEIRPSSLTSIKEAVKALITFGLIEIERPVGQDRLQHKHNKYYFLEHPAMFKLSGEPESDCPDGGSPKLSGEPESDCPNKEINNKDINSKNTNCVSSETQSPNGDGPAATSKPSRVRNKIKKRKTTITPKLQNENAVEIFLYWESLDLNCGGEGTKARAETVKTLNALMDGPDRFWHGSEFDSIAPPIITVEEIKKAIDRYAATTRQRVGPRYTLGQFIYQPHANTKRGKSLLIYYLINDPGEQLREDKYPVLTSAIKKEYERVILGGIKRKYTVSDCNCFILAAEKAMAFYEKHKNSLSYGDFGLPSKIAECMVESIIGVCSERNKIGPKWFCSQRQFEERLPGYLFDQGILTQQRARRFSIYDRNRQ